MTTTTPIEDLLQEMTTNTGSSVLDLSRQKPVLLVFLRHFGCTFCREALEDISRHRTAIEAHGAQIVFVHMSTDDIAEEYFTKYGIQNAVHIGDPTCSYYAAFGLSKGTYSQLFGLQTWLRGFHAGVVKGHGIGPQLGDGFQMPGIFVIADGRIRTQFIHKIASDRPDYEELARCCAV